MTFNNRTTHTENQSDWLYGYGVLLTDVQCHMYLYPYHDIENTGTYNWKYTWNHTVSNHPIHQHGQTNLLLVCMLNNWSTGTHILLSQVGNHWCKWWSIGALPLWETMVIQCWMIFQKQGFKIEPNYKYACESVASRIHAVFSRPECYDQTPFCKGHGKQFAER